jgi:hypothetical protein
VTSRTTIDGALGADGGREVDSGRACGLGLQAAESCAEVLEPSASAFARNSSVANRECDCRMLASELQDGAWRKVHHLYVAHCNDGCRAGAAVDQCYLAEVVPGAQHATLAS